MNGIDISAWQPANVTEIIKDYDFVIIKATEGVGYVSPSCDTQYQIAKSRGKMVGLYHFATGGDARAEAEFFAYNTKGYLGEAVFVLDWEAGAIARGADWVRTFVRRFKELTNVPPMIYGSASPLSAHGIPQLAQEENCGLWVASYPNNDNTGYRDEPQLLGSVIRQYTSKGRLADFSGNLDLNRSTLTPDQWRAYANGTRDGAVPAPTPTPPAPVRKSNEQVASEVVSGAWGNGEDRKNKLSGAGYDPSTIQSIVNSQLGQVAKKSNDQIASEVVGGLWGNGDDRKNKLSQAGYDYDAIQKIVNGAVGAPPARQTYRVVSGDNLSAIGSKTGVSWQTIAQLNNIKAPYTIYPNQVLAIN